jgi:acyl-CoA synthetase (AMP-forming)/AMP-acid ligase II
MPSDYVPGVAGDDLPLTDRLRHWALDRAHQRAFTFVDFTGPGSAGRHRTLTWSQLYARAQAIAAQVGAVARPGERAALLLPQGLDYVASFLGCLLARVIAVPLFPPDLPGHESRIAAVLEDCEPACVLLAPDGMAAALGSACGPLLARVPVVPIGAGGPVAARAPLAAGVSRDSATIDPDELAYLQYTSGSTRTPAGVMISHRNVVANALQGIAAFGTTSGPTTSVGWLPLFHDMGLVLSIAEPLVAGFPSVLMDPVAFLERPERWLRLLGAYPGALSAAPNFAYDYCAARVGAELLPGLRLDRVRALLNGSEPVRADTVRRFQRAFAGAGLRPESQCPSYGLAEATVFVATDGPDDVPRGVLCSRAALAEGRIVEVCGSGGTDGDAEVDTDASTELMSCGAPVGQELRIADPQTQAALPDGRVGEILLRGPNIGLGYWKRAQQSAEVFGARLLGADRPDDAGERPWLRTGDLGAIHEGRLLVTGRLKDLLIVDGRNHYPQDVEESLQAALDCVRQGRVAVFAVPGAAGDAGGELVVAVAEHRRGLEPDGPLRDEAERAARARISTAHGVRLDRLVLVPPGTVPRTSSGKVSRSACRGAFLRGEYEACSARTAEFAR